MSSTHCKMTLFETGSHLLLVVLCLVCQQTRGLKHVNLVGCIYDNTKNLNLHCEPSKLIYVVSVTLGRSSNQCRKAGSCCPAFNDGVVKGAPSNVQVLKDMCDGQQQCGIQLSQLIISKEKNDYESINYMCSNTPPVNSSGCRHEDNPSFNLHCEGHKRIRVYNAILGIRATTHRDTNTCPSNSVCEVFAQTQLVQRLKDTCDGLEHCQANVTKGECYYRGRSRRDTDYETVHYFCVNNLAASTAASTTSAALNTIALTPTSIKVTSTTTTNMSLAVTEASSTTDKVGSTPGNGDSDRIMSTDNRQLDVGLKAGIITAACVLVVVVAVLVIVIICRRRRRPAQDKLKTNLTEITGSNQSVQRDASQYDTIPEDIATQPSDDTHVYYDIRQTETPPGGIHAYYNEQSVARGANNSQPTSPSVSLDALYSKPNKPKRVDVSQDYRQNVTHGAMSSGVSGETPDDTEMVMVENYLYGTR